MISVFLNYDEEVLAHEIGFSRSKIMNGTAQNSHKYANEALSYHQFIAACAEAAGAEIAVAKYFKLTDFEPTVNTFKTQADVGNTIEVKHSNYIHAHLILTESDREDDIAVLVTNTSPLYYLVGWVPIKTARIRRNWRKSANSWWIIQNDLRPMEDFLKSDYSKNAFEKIMT